MFCSQSEKQAHNHSHNPPLHLFWLRWGLFIYFDKRTPNCRWCAFGRELLQLSGVWKCHWLCKIKQASQKCMSNTWIHSYWLAFFGISMCNSWGAGVFCFNLWIIPIITTKANTKQAQKVNWNSADKCDSTSTDHQANDKLISNRHASLSSLVGPFFLMRHMVVAESLGFNQTQQSQMWKD